MQTYTEQRASEILTELKTGKSQHASRRQLEILRELVSDGTYRSDGVKCRIESYNNGHCVNLVWLTELTENDV